MDAAWSRDRRVAVFGFGTLLILPIALVVVLILNRPGHSERENTTGTFGSAVPSESDPVTSLTPTPSPSPSASPSPAPSPTIAPTLSPAATTPARDRKPPTIGTAVTQYSGIWTSFWCSAGPNSTEIQIPVQDPTDPASALKVSVRFVLHREDQGTFDLDHKTVPSTSSPFVLQFGPYPGPNSAYAYNNVIDLVVTATDRAGNRSTRTFASFMTFNDCKADG